MPPNHVNHYADIESRSGTISGHDACLEWHRRRKPHRVKQQQCSPLRLRMTFSGQERGSGVGAYNRKLQVIDEGATSRHTHATLA